MEISSEQMRLIIQSMITLILAIAVHEFGHAYVAHRLGDRLPQRQGRVTLNPIAHMDPIGTLAFPLIFLIWSGGQSIGFGWGKPVQVQPGAFTRRFSMRTGHLMVAIAGPLMNIAFGVVISLVHVGLIKGGVIGPGHPLHEALVRAVWLNFILFFFNLIPAPPLDGGAVVRGLIPERMVPAFDRFSVYGPFVLMAVIFIPNAYRIFFEPAKWLLLNWYALIGL